MRGSEALRRVLEAARTGPGLPIAPSGAIDGAEEDDWGAEGFVQFPVFPRLQRAQMVEFPDTDRDPGIRQLASGEVQLWKFDLDELWQEEAADLLAVDERDRARRYRFGLHRRRFITGRAVVRSVLGAYLDEDPRRLSFEYGRQGKPSLRGPTDLVFNLSHSANLALLAVGRRAPLGVDVERIREIPELEAIARQTFSDREAAAVLRASGQQRRVRFFQCWTRKEAFVKALGGGLSIPLRAFDVSLEPQPRLLSVPGHQMEPQHWTMRQVIPRDDHVATVACRARAVILRCFVWPTSRSVLAESSGDDPSGGWIRPHAPSGNGSDPDVSRTLAVQSDPPASASRSLDSDRSGTTPEPHLRQEAR